MTLNLGSNGIGPLFELAILKEYAYFLKPHVVLWCYFEGNDLEDLQTEKASPLLMRYAEHDFTQGLLSIQTDLAQALTAYLDRAYNARRPLSVSGLQSRVENVLKFSAIRLRLGLNYGLSRADRREASEADMNLFRTVLSEAQTFVRSWGGSLYFIYLPAWPRYAGQGRIDNDRERVLTTVNSLEIPVIDVHGTFQAQSDPLAAFPFRLDSHYNELGHRLVAEAILQSLRHGAEVTPSSGPSITGTRGMTGSPETNASGNSIEDPQTSSRMTLLGKSRW
jgi:lysophospholipase L1-like esterase